MIDKHLIVIKSSKKTAHVIYVDFEETAKAKPKSDPEQEQLQKDQLKQEQQEEPKVAEQLEQRPPKPEQLEQEQPKPQQAP